MRVVLTETHTTHNGNYQGDGPTEKQYVEVLMLPLEAGKIYDFKALIFASVSSGQPGIKYGFETVFSSSGWRIDNISNTLTDGQNDEVVRIKTEISANNTVVQQPADETEVIIESSATIFCETADILRFWYAQVVASDYGIGIHQGSKIIATTGNSNE